MPARNGRTRSNEFYRTSRFRKERSVSRYGRNVGTIAIVFVGVPVSMERGLASGITTVG